MKKSDFIKQNKIRKIRHHAKIDILRAENPALDSLFQKLRTSTAPNFIDVMAAISNVSNLYPESEQGCDPTLCLTCG